MGVLVLKGEINVLKRKWLVKLSPHSNINIMLSVHFMIHTYKE